MLERVNLNKVFSVASSHGFAHCKIYAEFTVHTHIRIVDRIEDVRPSISTGISLTCSNEQQTLSFSTNRLSTDVLIHALTQRTSPPPAHLPDPAFVLSHLDSQSPPNAKELERKRGVISRLYKSVWSDNDRIQHPSLSYSDKKRFYEVASPGHPPLKGYEEEACCVGSWLLREDNRPTPYHHNHYRRQIDALLTEISTENPLKQSVSYSIRALNPWPTPQGEMAILWSNRALSKLCHAFTQCFEGDRVLDNRSFLVDVPLPIELPFSLVDNSPSPRELCDAEGSKRRQLVIFAEGRPRGLACDKHVAGQMNVAPTGHCRREAFDAPPTISFWHPELFADQLSDSLLDDIHGGLSIGDIEIRAFNPSNTKIKVILKEVNLVHDGQRGECLAPIEMDTSLLSLLNSLSHFSKTKKTTGLATQKHQQTLITDFTSPAAISPKLQIPGTVSTSHYW